jgi:14-3-3 protein epsilon
MTDSSCYDLAGLWNRYENQADKQRAALLALARVTCDAERWEDLYRITKMLIRAVALDTPGADLTSEERNFFCQATKQLLCATRAAWRQCKSDAATEDDVADLYTQYLERELLLIVTEVVDLLETTLIASVKSSEPQVFYRKLVGDCYRYLAEVSVPNAAVLPGAQAASTHPADATVSAIVPSGFGRKAAQAYQVALRMANAHLHSIHPTRLGLCLNFSVLLFEVLKDQKQAIDLAIAAFEHAVPHVDELEHEQYYNTLLLMQLLQDNVRLWRGAKAAK